MAASIHIVETPQGDAPLWVREKWIGLTLPLIYPHAYQTYGASVFEKPRRVSRLGMLWNVLSGKWKRWHGFSVDVNAALAILETRSPEAAAWWRTNTPHLLGQYFMFDYGCCEPADPEGANTSGGDPARN